MYISFYNFKTVTAMLLSEQDVDYAIELYNSSATIPDIARLFDVTKQAISQCFKKRGVKRRPPVIPMTVFEIIEERKRKNYLTDEEIKKRNKAYLIVAKARQEGLLPRKPCEVCGEQNLKRITTTMINR